MSRFPLRPAPLAAAVLLLATIFLAPSRTPAQVVINEVVAANARSNLDDDGDASDWIELHNPGAQAIELEGYGISDRPTEPHFWVLPNSRLEPGEFLVVWCSGKDRTSPSADVIESRRGPDVEPVLIDGDTKWRFLTGDPVEVPPPENWNRLGFDDTLWETGQPGFGFGTSDVRTELPRNMGTVFLRRVFHVESPDRLPNLVLQTRFDDGFVAFLNGERVASAGFPAGQSLTFASRSTRSHSPRRVERFNLTEERHLLQDGDNVLAIALVNFSVASTDLFLLPELGTVPPVLHTNFRLSREGEVVFISDPLGEFVDGIQFPVQNEDRSYGRFPDGSGNLVYMLTATPGMPNDDRISQELISSRPTFEPPGGKHDAPVQVAITANLPLPEFEIRYTLDGRRPTAASPLYTSPIGVTRDQVIRAAAFTGNEQILPHQSQSYFLSNRASRLVLPILSISMDPRDFQTVHLNASARGRSSERPSFLEIFDENGAPALSTGFGLRLHGGAGRGGDLRVKKAYKAYFRRIYGDGRLRYRLIPDTPVESFDQLVLRSNFNDAFRTGGGAALIRDQLIRDLHEDMGATVSHGSWNNLFINGEYRGVYNIVERMDKSFLASYFPEDGENWDVIKTGNDVLDGTSAEWNRLRSFVRLDLRREDLYRQAQESIDIENFTSYMILNIWAQNHDWPHNNWYAARPRRPDGQWIFLSWDAEFGIGRNPGGFGSDTFQHVFNRSDAPLTTILSGLLRNSDYQRFFLEEVDRHLSQALAPGNVLVHIRRLRDIIVRDIPAEVSVAGGSISSWNANIRNMENFARGRNARIRSFIFNSSRFTFPRITGVDPRRLTAVEGSMIAVNGSRFSRSTRIFFNDIPSPEVVFQSSRRLEAAVPFDARLEGLVDVSAEDQQGNRSTLPEVLEISFVRPRPVFLDPTHGSSLGGDEITIIGEGFLDGVRVEFGGVPAPSASLIAESSEILQVITPPGEGTVPVRVINTRPGQLPAENVLEFSYVAEAGFRRGDTNADDQLNITDAILVLEYLFSGKGAPCVDALDIDDSGGVNVTDAVVLLGYLFLSPDRTPAEPFEQCGADRTGDDLSCEAGGCS